MDGISILISTSNRIKRLVKKNYKIIIGSKTISDFAVYVRKDS